MSERAKALTNKTVEDIKKAREERARKKEHEYMAYQKYKSKRTNRMRIEGEK